MRREIIICGTLTTIAITMVFAFTRLINQDITKINVSKINYNNMILSTDEIDITISYNNTLVIPLEMMRTIDSLDPVPERIEVFENMTLYELAEHIERHMNSTITGKGYLIARLSVETGIDPFLATAIILHETGCRSNCSRLVNYCNNVGGITGGPTRCGNGRFRSYPTLYDGFVGFFDVLYRVYFSRGLTTPELMGPIYAESPYWPAQIHSHMNRIRSN